jgi:hypothetical protein
VPADHRRSSCPNSAALGSALAKLFDGELHSLAASGLGIAGRCQEQVASGRDRQLADQFHDLFVRQFHGGHPTGLDLARADGLDDGRDADEEVVFVLLVFKAVVEAVADVRQALLKGGMGALRDFVTHQDAYGVDFLPFVFEGQEGADLEIAAGDVDRLGERGLVQRHFSILGLKAL